MSKSGAVVRPPRSSLGFRTEDTGAFPVLRASFPALLPWKTGEQHVSTSRARCRESLCGRPSVQLVKARRPRNARGAGEGGGPKPRLPHPAPGCQCEHAERAKKHRRGAPSAQVPSGPCPIILPSLTDPEGHPTFLAEAGRSRHCLGLAGPGFVQALVGGGRAAVCRCASGVRRDLRRATRVEGHDIPREARGRGDLGASSASHDSLSTVAGFRVVSILTPLPEDGPRTGHAGAAMLWVGRTRRGTACPPRPSLAWPLDVSFLLFFLRGGAGDLKDAWYRVMRYPVSDPTRAQPFVIPRPSLTPATAAPNARPSVSSNNRRPVPRLTW